MANIIERTIAEERLQAAQQRGAMREYLIDYYEENQHDKDEYLRAWGFQRKTALPLTSTRLVKRVIDTLSMVYKQPPNRYLFDKNGNKIEKNGIADFESDNYEFNVQLKKCERYFNLLKNVLFRIAYDDEAGKMYFYIETDYIPEFGRNNNIYPIGYHIPLPIDTDKKDSEEQLYLFISDELYYIHDGITDEKMPVPPFDDITNPYGIMPIIDFSEPCAGTYWNMGAKSLVDVARHYNIGMLNTAYAHHFQCFDQAWTRGLRSENLPKDAYGNPVLKVGSDEAWNLGDDGAAGLLGFNPKLVESIEFYRGWLNMELANYGLQAVFKESGNPMSGFALKVSKIELLEKRQADVDFYKVKEQEIYEVLRVMNEYHGLGYNMPRESWLITDFVEPDFPSDPADERAEWEWKWANNLASKEDYLMAKNPDLDEETASKIIEKNTMANRPTRGLFPSATNNGQQQ